MVQDRNTKNMIRKLKQLIKPPGSNLRHGVRISYKGLFKGLKRILRGDIVFDYDDGIIGCLPLYPFDGKSPASEKYEHEFAIAAIVKDEGMYLKEWIEFHNMIGCTRFFIYDNNSSDNTREILDEYKKKGLVDWIDWPHIAPWINTQHLAYVHAIYRCRGNVRWLALIDLDEFIFSPLYKKIPDFLQNYVDLPAIVVFWDMFGTSGHESRPQGLVIENYIRRVDIGHPDNTYTPLTKSIVQPHRVRAVSDVHFFQTDVWPAIGYDENRILITKARDIHPQKGIRIHHYYTKSLEDWHGRLKRKTRGTGCKVDSRSTFYRSSEKLFHQLHKHEVEDRSIHFLLPELRVRMKESHEG